jgi:5-methyltetrahydropteroyltriglutamate--homocysteine methyltransferase
VHPDDGIFFDDIGSFPLPTGVQVQSLNNEEYLEIVKDAFAKKIAAGIEIPTYPQFRNMVHMFMDLIQAPEFQESPFLLKREHAQILELQALKSGQLRVCVTGPVELYLSVFGATNYFDILCNIAKSVARFLEMAKEIGIMVVASIDEPSLGISSNVVFSQDELLQALEIASRPCRRMDCEVHLHSPIFVDLCCLVTGINIVGVESAAHPDYLKLIDKRLLDETDTFLRAGIARTDLFSMAAQLNERCGTNLWEDMVRLEEEIMRMESEEVIEKRLSNAYDLFGERIKAAGPDCGLGSWPSQFMAMRLLSNCAKAFETFRKRSTF